MDRAPVSSFRLTTLAREQLASLAESRGVSHSRMVELLVEKAINDPDSYYLRLTAHHALAASAASLAIAQMVSRPLASWLGRTIADQASQILGPLPSRPPSLPDKPDSEPVRIFLAGLAGLTAEARRHATEAD